MDYKALYEHWCKNADNETVEELRSLNDTEIYDRFYTAMEFGTGGLRGVIGAGTNRMNKYTIRKATQGFAMYIKTLGKDACSRGVVIAHDNRRKSIEFSKETAGVLAANGITAYLFDSLRPTPELSFAVRNLKAAGGVMITASHNPPEYNGYKIYDENGCQLVPHLNDKVVEKINEIEDELKIKVLNEDEAGELIRRISPDLDEKYYNEVMKISLNDTVDRSSLKVVYSPQHGTGNIPVRTVLTRLGYDLVPVLAQCEPDTEFSNTKNPNPETKEAFELPVQVAKEVGADIAITTDPDCDRLGVAVKQGDDYILMTGNQSGAVLLKYILEQRISKGTLPKNPIMFNTIVTSNIGDSICKKYGVEVEKTLTGFKFIGDKIHKYEQTNEKQFVFGYEESYGYLISDIVRDKDAVQSSLMLCEAAAYYKAEGKTLYDVLLEIYDEFGFYKDSLTNVVLKGADGAEKIQQLLRDLRNNPPASAANIDIVKVEDYESKEMLDLGFPKSNVLKYILADGSWVAVRPSGTEPKCKYYYCVVAENESAANDKLAAFKKVFEK